MMPTDRPTRCLSATVRRMILSSCAGFGVCAREVAAAVNSAMRNFRMKDLVTVVRTALALALAAPIHAIVGAQNPAAIEHGLRLPTSSRGAATFELLDRMKLYHVPGVSIAVVDSSRVVFAKGFGVKEFGAAAPVDTAT